MVSPLDKSDDLQVREIPAPSEINPRDSAIDIGNPTTPASAPVSAHSSTRSASLYQRLCDLVLGTDTVQRGYIRTFFLTVWIYTISVGLMWYGVHIQLFNAAQTKILAACCISSTTIFYIIMRSGLNKRVAAPTLAVPQTLVAQSWIIVAYAITGPLHAGVMIFLALVMVFGMFNMAARHANWVALYTTILFGLTVWFKSVVDPQIYVLKIEVINLILSATTLFAIAQLAAKLSRLRQRLKEQKQDLEKAFASMQAMAIRDELTGLYNRRYLRQIIDEHIQRLQRGGQLFYVALIDLDYFKQVNDTYGHLVGDEILKAFSVHMMKTQRNTDILGRWGGEEFLLLCLDPKPEQSTLCLSRLRIELLKLVVSADHPDLRITFSAGMTKYHCDETIDAALERADKALYEAKAAGRDKTILL